jgi:hypothetical protein
VPGQPGNDMDCANIVTQNPLRGFARLLDTGQGGEHAGPRTGHPNTTCARRRGLQRGQRSLHLRLPSRDHRL